MKNRIKNTLIILGMVGAFVYYITCPQWTMRTASYSGSLAVLNENGIVTMSDGLLTYEDYNGFLSTDEIQALNTLSRQYSIEYRVMFSELTFE